MKKVNLYEFKDLNKETQKEVIGKTIITLVETEIEELSHQLEKGLLGKTEYYKILGCSESYAESTGWFVPSCYYEKHKEEVDKEAEKVVETELYTKAGRFVMLI